MESYLHRTACRVVILPRKTAECKHGWQSQAFVGVFDPMRWLNAMMATICSTRKGHFVFRTSFGVAMPFLRSIM